MKINRERLKALCAVKLVRQDEDVDFRDDLDDKDSIAWIVQQIREGNPWAWFSAKVTVRFHELQSDQYLGCCSYESEENFRTCGYYEQMIDEGVAEIADMLENYALEHRIWEHDQTTCVWCVVGT